MTGFGGLAGRVAARVMARSNREAEGEAIEALDPGDRCRSVAAWFGWIAPMCEAHGLVEARRWAAAAEGGRCVGFSVTRDA